MIYERGDKNRVTLGEHKFMVPGRNMEEECHLVGDIPVDGHVGQVVMVECPACRTSITTEVKAPLSIGQS